MNIRILTRRDFLKISSGAAAALGLSRLTFSQKLFAQTGDADKPAVVWLEAQDCTGCTESVLSSLTPDLRDVLVGTINMQYHETVMSGAGYKAEEALAAAIAQGGYVLVVEGSIPAADKRFLEVAGVPVEDTFVSVAQNAAVILAVGACACYGGIPKAGVTQGEGVEYFLSKYGISKTLINLPGCPTNPVWFYDTVISFLNGENIPLDNNKRPLCHFSKTVHSQCYRRHHRKNGRFLTDWNDPSQKDYCLLLKGCKGKETFSDCPLVKWNDGVNWCVQSGAPCSGCTEPAFYRDLAPLFQR